MDSIKEVVGKLRKALQNNNLIVCVGAGCSAATVESVSKYPCVTWSGLLQEGIDFCASRGLVSPGQIDNLRSDLDQSEYISAASKLVDRLGGTDSDNYRDWLGNTVGKLEPSYPKLLLTLSLLKVPILTTNYDSLIEQVTNYTSYNQQTNSEELQKCIRGDQMGVIHVHGIWNDPKTVVIDFKSYYKIRENRPIQQILQSLLVTKTVLFIGFGGGLNDPNFEPLITNYKSDFPLLPHYQLLVSKNVPAYRPVTGVVPVSYGDKYEDLEPFLQLLITKTSEERKDDFIRGLQSWREALDRVYLNGRWPKSDYQQKQFHQMSSDMYAITSEIQKTTNVTQGQKDRVIDVSENMAQLITDILYEAMNAKLTTRQELSEWLTIHQYAQLSVVTRLKDLL